MAMVGLGLFVLAASFLVAHATDSLADFIRSVIMNRLARR